LVVVCFRGREDVEINCHGGTASVDELLHALEQAGAAVIDWQALLPLLCRNMIEAEAIAALAAARTQRTTAMLLDQLNGALEAAVRDIIGLLSREDTLGLAEARLRRLLGLAQFGLKLIEGWRIAIVGRPNVGKSSLVNAIVGYDRAITAPSEGTTRDVIRIESAVGGLPVELFDSAGIDTPGDELEHLAVQRTIKLAGRSDLQLVVLDLSRTLSDRDREILQLCQNPLIVANKADLPDAWRAEQLFPEAVKVSALTGENVSKLLDKLSARLCESGPEPGAAVPFTNRQVVLLRAAAEHLQAAKPDQAGGKLVELIGSGQCCSSASGVG